MTRQRVLCQCWRTHGKWSDHLKNPGAYDPLSEIETKGFSPTSFTRFVPGESYRPGLFLRRAMFDEKFENYLAILARDHRKKKYVPICYEHPQKKRT